MECRECGKQFETVKELTVHLVKEHKYNREQVYSYYEYSLDTGEANCPICGVYFKLSAKQKREYRKRESAVACCCLSCTQSLRNLLNGSSFSRADVREKSKKTMLDRYGVESSLKSKEIREKTKKTNLERYGAENPMQSKEIQEKTKKTNLERYGVESPAQSKEIQEKMKKTNLERYGVEAPAQLEEVRDKMRKTTFDRYGVENASQSDVVKNKRKQTMLDLYGVKYVYQLPKYIAEVIDKINKTNMERYGVKRPAQSKEIQEKMKKTNLEKYGVEYSITSDEVKEKSAKTNLERYGVDNVFKSPEFREKAKQTNKRKYGVEHASQSPEIQEKIRRVMQDTYGVDYFCQHEKCLSKNGFRISKVNRNFQELLKEYGVDSDLEFILEDVGYDLKADNVLIEINPYFTHNSTFGPCFGGKRREPIKEDYHLHKTEKAEEHGYRCIHVFDWDDPEKIINLLTPKRTLFARECVVKEVSNKDAHEFLGQYHIQGSTKQIKRAVGLFYEDELVQVMTFGKPRYNKNYEYELLRLCARPDVKITGGASKALKYFESTYKPNSLISYCDLSKFNGDVYKKLGFTLASRTVPTKHWYNPKTKKHYTDNLLRQRGFDQLHGTDFGKGTSNEELMLQHGYVEIYDCGQLVFVKKY